MTPERPPDPFQDLKALYGVPTLFKLLNHHFELPLMAQCHLVQVGVGTLVFITTARQIKFIQHEGGTLIVNKALPADVNAKVYSADPLTKKVALTGFSYTEFSSAKREHQRLPMRGGVDVTMAHMGASAVGRMKDISLGGLAATLPEREPDALTVGNVISVNFQIMEAGFHTGEMVTQAEVMGANDVPDGRLIRLRFIDFPDSYRATLVQLLELFQDRAMHGLRSSV